MDTALLSLALTAGAVAALNPCGFALLPAYLGLMVGGGEMRPRTAVRRALVSAAVMTGGFVVVFAAFGLIVAPVAASAQRYLPWVTLVTGIGLAGLGLGLLTGRRLRLPAFRLGRTAADSALLSTFLYGVTYALASLTCTVAPFLAVVVTSLRSAEFLSGLALFLTYAVGMGIVVGVAAVAVALARTGAVGTMRRTARWMPWISGALVLLVGCYVAYYGLWEIRVLHGADPADPVIERALSVQAWLSGRVREAFSFSG